MFSTHLSMMVIIGSNSKILHHVSYCMVDGARVDGMGLGTFISH